MAKSNIDSCISLHIQASSNLSEFVVAVLRGSSIILFWTPEKYSSGRIQNYNFFLVQSRTEY